ncbi:hypothetical protein TIFTF001_010815 [Ficus carica]|uniref:DNA (cytosine-5-)-methyltransferase n=1 Tax=Ficus carica TaxID=3494 RepID=A0AA88D3P8_FICCA|nr:hypothetical protein TIFTF001_010815 [Ficus carica]
MEEDDQVLHLPNPMTGFGVPNNPCVSSDEEVVAKVGQADLAELHSDEGCTGHSHGEIRRDVERYGGDEPAPHVKKNVLEEIRKWNLVWAGKNKVASLDPDELEFFLGFPKGHTRGICTTNRYVALGNSFEVDTVAYHLLVLKGRYPNGINVLSLFSGIGGAEVALHRLGILLRNVVSVEKSEASKDILRNWWEQTNQQGNLIEVEDVEKVTVERVEQWMSQFGGFDIVIGGSPCNNLAGGNRDSRDGLAGEQSLLFFDYSRILDLVQSI